MRKQKILIVDDVPVNIQVLNELLCNEYDVLIATSGADALSLVDEIAPDLILLDIMMPEMDGFTVCGVLKTKPHLKDVPIIFITALKDAVDECYGLELGAVDFVTKPFNPASVKLRIRNQLGLKQSRELYKTAALLDGLTGIANRRAFDQRLELEWHHAVRHKSSLSLIMIDIDYFKNYNDEYHHQAGDECLKMVARVIADSLSRSLDLAARYGGEEFVCLMPDTSETGVFLIAEKIRNAVESLNIPHNGSKCSSHVTVSLGCATIFPQKGIPFGGLTEKADMALYSAKNDGRNRTRAYTASSQ